MSEPAGFIATPVQDTFARSLKDGSVIVIYDDDRDCADFVAAASIVEPASIALMAKHGGGIIALALNWDRCLEIGIQSFAPRKVLQPNAFDDRALPLTSIEARQGVTTGISAADRAHTIKTAVDATGPSELVSPGHVFPVPAASGGLLEKRGRAEAAVDAARLAGLGSAAVICDLLDESGRLADAEAARSIGAALGLECISVTELRELRLDIQWG